MEISEEERENLKAALMKAAIGYVDNERFQEEVADEETGSRTIRKRQREVKVPANPALIMRLLDDDSRIGGPQDYC